MAPKLQAGSSISPRITTSHAPKKPRHRLIRTPNLHLMKRGFHARAVVLRTLHHRLLRIIPHLWPAENIFPLLPRVRLALVDGFRDYVFVGTGLAFQAVYGFPIGVLIRGGGDGLRGDGEHVAAGRAEE